MIKPNTKNMSIEHQCALVEISRSSYYYKHKGERAENLALMRLIDAQFMETPYFGSRQMRKHFKRQSYKVGRKECVV